MTQNYIKIKSFTNLNPIIFKLGLEKEYIFYATLKKRYDSHHGYKTSKGILKMANIMGCKPSTMRKYIKKLIDLGWAFEDRNGLDLRLIGYKKLLEKYEIENNHAELIPYIGKDTALLLIHGTIKLNLDRQGYRFGEKLGQKSKVLRKIYKSGNKQMAVSEFINGRLRTSFNANHDITLSRKSIAQLANRKSSYTGTNLIKRLDRVGLIKTDVHRITKLADKSGGEHREVFDSSVYQNTKGEVWMQVPNLLEVYDIDVLDGLLRRIVQASKKGVNMDVVYNAPISENIYNWVANCKSNSVVFKELVKKENLSGMVNKGLSILNYNDPLRQLYVAKSMERA